MASFHRSGNWLVDKDVFTIFFITGSKISKQLITNDEGAGSNGHVFFDDFMTRLLISLLVSR